MIQIIPSVMISIHSFSFFILRRDGESSACMKSLDLDLAWGFYALEKWSTQSKNEYWIMIVLDE